MNLHLDRRQWKRVKFGDVVRNVNEYFDRDGGGVLPYVAGPHIEPGELRPRYGSTDDDVFPPTFKRMFIAGDVLIHSRGIEKVAVPDRSGVTGEKLFVLRSLDAGILDQRFLPFLVMSPLTRKHMADNFTGSVNKFLNWKPLAALEFDLPPLNQQRQIADLFWAVEANLEAQRTIAAKASLLERGLIVGTLDLPGPIFELQEIGNVLMGRQRAPQYATGDNIVPYLRVANIGDNMLRLSDVKEMNFDLREVEHYRLQVDDILVSEGQSRELVGQAARIDKVSRIICFQNTLIRFRPNRAATHPEFAYALIRALFYSGHFASLASQTTSIAHLGVKRFATCKVAIPPGEVQLRRLEQIQMTQKAVAAAALVVDKAFSLRQSLLEEVFSS